MRNQVEEPHKISKVSRARTPRNAKIILTNLHTSCGKPRGLQPSGLTRTTQTGPLVKISMASGGHGLITSTHLPTNAGLEGHHMATQVINGNKQNMTEQSYSILFQC